MKVLKMNLKKDMRSRHMLSHDLAEKMGVSLVTVSLWRTGRLPSMFNLELLMNVLECTPAELLTLEEVERRNGH
mgnify:CR=1 FL=1